MNNNDYNITRYQMNTAHT